MNVPTLSPAARSRRCWSMGSRARAWTPVSCTRPEVAAYRSLGCGRAIVSVIRSSGLTVGGCLLTIYLAGGAGGDGVEVQGGPGEAAAFGPDGAQRAGQVHAGDRDGAQGTGGEFGRDGQRAEHGRGRPGRDRGLDRGGGGQFGRRRHAFQAGLGAQRLLEVAPGARPGLPADQRGPGQPGGRYSATVMLAAMRSRESRSRRSATTPASSDAAASTTACAQPATSAPA